MLDALGLAPLGPLALGDREDWGGVRARPKRRGKALSCLDNIGLFSCCMPDLGPQILRLTLLTAKDVPCRSGFYFEVWTEPTTEHPKISRVHRRRAGWENLGAEQLELEWLADTGELVIHLVDYVGGAQCRDVPKNQLRLPRAAVQRYAQETRASGGEHLGARSFRMTQVAPQIALSRKRRFQDWLLPPQLGNWMFSKFGEEMGVPIPSVADLDKLRQENEALRRENVTLRAQSGTPGDFNVQPDAAGHLTTALVAVGFELIPKRYMRTGVDVVVRKASFQETAEH